MSGCLKTSVKSSSARPETYYGVQLPKPLTAQSTVRTMDGAGVSSEPAPVQAEAAIVPPDFQRQKVPLEKGFSQMDWLQLKRRGKDLNGKDLNGADKRASKGSYISMDEVKQHNTEQDGWTVIKGIVYNVSPYLRFHPGGAKIMKLSLGKDSTVLFNKYHPWVNVAALMDRCVVGLLERKQMPTHAEAPSELKPA